MAEQSTESGAGSRSRWQKEYDALPEWARALVRASSSIIMHGAGVDRDMLCGLSDRDKYDGFHIVLEKDALKDWWVGFDGMHDLAEAITAPHPPAPPPDRKSTFTPGVVEMCADESAFDQPCAWGNRVDGHAVYCHHPSWPNSPRKCRRTWHTGGETRDEDCPGFTPNPTQPAQESATAAVPQRPGRLPEA